MIFCSHCILGCGSWSHNKHILSIFSSLRNQHPIVSHSLKSAVKINERYKKLFVVCALYRHMQFKIGYHMIRFKAQSTWRKKIHFQVYFAIIHFLFIVPFIIQISYFSMEELCNSWNTIFINNCKTRQVKNYEKTWLIVPILKNSPSFHSIFPR